MQCAPRYDRTSSGSTTQDQPGLLYNAGGRFGPLSPTYGSMFPLSPWAQQPYEAYQATICVFSSATARWGDLQSGDYIKGYREDPNNPGYPDTS